MSTNRFLLAALLLLGLCPAPLRAEPPGVHPAPEATTQVLLDSIRANRKALVAVNLDLTEDEAAKFWPVYDRYQKEINAVGDRLVAVIEDYTASFGNLSDDKARKLVDDYLAVEADRIGIRRRYVTDFAEILAGRKMARLYQIENKIDAVLRYDLAATIPVVEEEGGAGSAEGAK